MTLEKAIEILKQEYAEAEQQPWIMNKIGWALYQTMKKVNREAENEKAQI